MKKLLIANRGEIAVRIMRTAKRLGIATVAIYSDADRHALHTRLADEAFYVGPSEAPQSYLNIDRVMAAAIDSGADAIHPGYGFLSERAEFVEACERAGVIFVGPPASAMRLLGSKTDAKTLAVREAVPIVPGMFDPTASGEELKRAAVDLGLPVLLKAAAGGGGRGMRAVYEIEKFDDELRTASDEALKSFGDGTMMVEKLVERPRHIEVQIIADAHGNVAALFERECSIQRRHQKLIEEAPAANEVFDWPAIRDAAIRLCRSAGYVNAGTVEFIVDQDGNFYFLEVNARLQVEHPVTESITGLDLVECQLNIADGQRLSIDPKLMSGDRSMIHGHSIEARVVAENPGRHFLPSTGRIQTWKPPQSSVRLDTGFEEGSHVSRYYDSLLAKVIARGSNRAEAIQNLRAALLDFHIVGVHTNIAFLLDLLNTQAFINGRMDTNFIEREMSNWHPPAPPSEFADIVSAAVETGQVGPWQAKDAYRNARH